VIWIKDLGDENVVKLESRIEKPASVIHHNVVWSHVIIIFCNSVRHSGVQTFGQIGQSSKRISQNATFLKQLYQLDDVLRVTISELFAENKTFNCRRTFSIKMRLSTFWADKFRIRNKVFLLTITIKKPKYYLTVDVL